MAEKLTPEQKEYISSLAEQGYSREQLSGITEAILRKGIRKPEPEQAFLPLSMEEKSLLPAEKEPLVKEETPNRNARAEPEEKTAAEKNAAKPETPSEVPEDAAEILSMAKDVVRQLNEVKAKYEAMDEFIHNHVLERKDREIDRLEEENRRLRAELEKTKNEIRAAPFPSSPMPEKKAHKIAPLKFWRKRTSQNYIIKLFSNPKFTAEQISEIRMGLEADLDETQIKSYARQEISARQMKEIRMLYELQNRKQNGNEKGDV